MEEDVEMELGEGWNEDDITELIRNLDLKTECRVTEIKVYENALMEDMKLLNIDSMQDVDMENDAEIVDRMFVM